MRRVALMVLCLAALPAAAQVPVAPPPNSGTLVIMTGSAEIELPNDEAVANFFYEAQDADLAKAQSLVNQRVGDGTAALRRADPKAQIETSGYGSYPVYASGPSRGIVGWRVRQGVTLKTDNLRDPAEDGGRRPSRLLSVGGVDFRLSKAAREKVETQLIQQAIANLNARVAAAAQALGVPPNREFAWKKSTLAGARADRSPSGSPRMATMSSDAVPPPTFEVRALRRNACGDGQSASVAISDRCRQDESATVRVRAAVPIPLSLN